MTNDDLGVYLSWNDKNCYTDNTSRLSLNPAVHNNSICQRRLPTDYPVLISIIIEVLPRWIEVQSTNKRQEVQWTKRSVVYLKTGTNLICSKEDGRVYILIERRIELEKIGGKNRIGA